MMIYQIQYYLLHHLQVCFSIYVTLIVFCKHYCSVFLNFNKKSIILTFTANVKLQSTVKNKSMVESNTVRKYTVKKNELSTTSAYNKSSSETVKSSEKHCERENHELPTTSAYKSSSETVKPSDNLSGNIKNYILFLFLLKIGSTY